MSLTLCPIQYLCPKYANGTEDKGHYIRSKHPCNDFLATCCNMGIQLEMFLADMPIACKIKKTIVAEKVDAKQKGGKDDSC